MPLTNGRIIRKAAKINGTYSVIYTCPGAIAAKVDSLLVANLHASYDMQVWVGVESSGVFYEWVSGAKIAGSTWEPRGRTPLILETKTTLEAGDIVKAKIAALNQPSWVSSSYDASICLSVVEFSVS